MTAKFYICFPFCLFLFLNTTILSAEAPAGVPVPYVEGFEGAPVPNMVAGWTVINGNGDLKEWQTSNSVAYSGVQAARMPFDNSLTADEWLISPGIALTAGVTYQLQFVYRAAGTFGNERMKLYWGTGNTADDLTMQLFGEEQFNNTNWQRMQIQFTAEANGDYYFGFHGYSYKHNFGIYIDDFSVKTVQPTAVLDNGNDDLCQSYQARGVFAEDVWYDIIDENGDLIASVNPQGEDLGTVTVEMKDVSGVLVTGATNTPNPIKMMPRFFNFSSSKFGQGVYFTNPVKLRLYFQSEEMTDFNNDVQGSGQGNPTIWSPSDLNITHYSGENEDCNPFNNNYQTALHKDWINNLIGGSTAGGDVYVEYEVEHFSESMTHEPSGGALPVELGFFRATKQSSSILLEWVTFSEEENAGFEIQRSGDGRDWEVLGFVEGQGSTTEKQTYEFVDENPKLLNYYRLKQVDYDGTVNLSDVIFREFEEKGKFALKVFPNPINDGWATIEYQSITEPVEAIKILNMDGRILFEKDFDNSNLYYKNEINVRNFSPGIYFIHIQAGRVQQQQKFVIH